MFHFVQGETKSSDLIDDPIEKSGELLHGALETPFDNPMNHGRIINVDPEGQPLPPFFKGTEIEGSQSPREIFVSLELLRASDRFITDRATLHVYESRFQIRHRECQGNVEGLFRRNWIWSPSVEDNG